ncbi:MAG: hypothetical protein AAF583_01655 [Pseudomonadota bacterium]
MPNSPFEDARERRESDGANPFDEAANRRDRRAQATLGSVIDTPPDQAAEVIDLSERTGLPFKTATSQRERIQGEVQRRSLAQTLRDSPATAAFVTDHQNAAVAQDSIEQLAEIERLLGERRKEVGFVQGVGEFFAKSPQAARAAVPAFKEGLQGVLLAAGENIPNIPGINFRDNFEIAGRKPITEALARERQSRQELTPTSDSTTVQAALSGITSLANMAPYLIAGGLLRSPNVAAGGLSVQTAGQSYAEARAEGLSIEDSLEFAGAQGGIEFITEKIPLDILFGGEAGQQFASRLIKSLAAEQVTEQVATHAQDFVSWQYLNPEKTVEQYIAERPEAAYATAIATLVATGPTNATFLALEKLAGSRRSEESTTEQTAESLTRLREAVEAAPVFARRRASVEEFIAGATEGETVLLDDEGISQLYQSGAEGRTLLQDGLGLTDDQLSTAINQGQDIEVDAARLLTVNDGFDQLVDITRLRDGDLTPREAREQAEQDALSVDYADLQERLTERDDALAGPERAGQLVTEQLLAAGRSPEEAQAAGAIWSSMFNVLASDGVDTDSVFERLGLKVETAGRIEQPRADQQTLNQAQDAGYEGTDRGEAAEWLRAQRDGLDMSIDARYARLREQGYNTDTVLYHGGRGADDIRQLDSQRPTYFTDDPEVAGKFSSNTDGVIYPVFAKGKIKEIDTSIREEDNLSYLLMTDDYLLSFGQQSTKRKEIERLKSEGFSIIKNSLDRAGEAYQGKFEYIVLDPSNIRSVHAAAHPDYVDSSNLLAQPYAAPEYNRERDILNTQRELQRDEAFAAKPESVQLREAAELVDQRRAEQNEILDTAALSSQIAAASERARVPNDQLFQSRLLLDEDARVYGSGSPDPFGFITSAERALSNPPPRFRDAKALTAEQWRKYFTEAQVGKEGFDFLIEPALASIDRSANQDITKEEITEAIARQRPEIIVEDRIRGQYNRTPFFGQIAQEFSLSGSKGLRERFANYAAGHGFVRSEQRKKSGPETGYKDYISRGPSSRYEQQLIIMPDAAAGFRSHNWFSKGVIGHIRSTLRRSDKGKVVFVDELQSDLHQDGALRGYDGDGRFDKLDKQIDVAKEENRVAREAWERWQDDPQLNTDFVPISTRAQYISDDTGRELRSTYSGTYRTLQALLAERGKVQPPRAPGRDWEKPFIRRALQRGIEERRNIVAFTSYETLNFQLQTEGTKKFYDQRMPAHIRKVAKELGAEVIKVKVKGQKSQVLAIKLTPKAKAKLAEGNVLFQPDGENARAVVDIPGGFGVGGILSNDGDTTVRLSQAADRSTFLHESAHIFLELYSALETENAQVAGRMANIRKWLEVEEGAPLTREQHETFADSFELYLMKGEAPNAELKGVFDQFRAWLTQVYRRIRQRLTNLDPQARDIFDRMLATEEEIGLAREDFGRVVSGYMRRIMSPEQIEKYQDEARKVGELGRDRLFRKHLDEIEKRNQDATKRRRREIKKEFSEQLRELPVYRAEGVLKKRKLNLAKLREVKREGFEEYATERAKGDPELIAAEAGFPSADHMLNALAEAEPFAEALESLTEDAMRQEFGDLLTDGSATQEAVRAVFNDPSVRMLEVERDALAEKALQDPIPLNTIRRIADQMVATSPIRNMSPGRHAIKARDLHKRAVRAAARQEWDAALRETHKAMLHHEVARRAYKVRDEYERGRRYLQRFAAHRKLDAKKIGPEYIGQIRRLMALPGQDSQSESLRDLRDFWDQQQDLGEPVILPSLVLMGRPLPELRNMTIGDFREFRDSIRNLNKVGRDNSEAAKAAFRERAGVIASFIRDSYTGTLKEEKRAPSNTDKAKSFLRKLESEMLRWPFLVEALAGNKKDGAIVDEFDTKLRQKLTQRNARRQSLHEELVSILKTLGITQKELGRDVQAAAIQADAVKFEQVLSVALNWGNETNRERLANDPAMAGDIVALQAMLDQHMEQRHWDAVQEIWNLIDSLWPEASALEKRLSGVAPKKVEASRVETRFGTYAGGYYPLKYDTEFLANEDIGRNQEEDLWKQATNGMATRASTPQGHLVERQTNVTRPVRLSMDVVLSHFDDVTNDIYMRETANGINKLLLNKDVRKAISQTQGKEYLQSMETILKRTVAGTERASGLEGLFRTFRINASVAILGHNVVTAALAPISYFQTVLPRYGAKTVLSGMAAFYRDPIGVNNYIKERSAFMRERADTLNREAHELIRKTAGQGAWAKFQGAGYWLMTTVEKATVSGPLWMGVYSDAIAKGDSEADAITKADRAIATTQGSGLEIDQSVLQSGNEFQRYLTFMYGYMSGYYGTVRNEIMTEQGLKKLIPVVKHLAIMNMFAAMMEALIREGLGGEEDPYLENVARLMRRNIVGMIPFASSIFSRYDSGPAVSQVGADIGKAVEGYYRVSAEYYEDGYFDGDRFRRANLDASSAIGLATGIPGTIQAQKIEKTYREDDDPTLYEALVTGPDN